MTFFTNPYSNANPGFFQGSNTVSLVPQPGTVVIKDVSATVSQSNFSAKLQAIDFSAVLNTVDSIPEDSYDTNTRY
jgi:hypothetical protein